MFPDIIAVYGYKMYWILNDYVSFSDKGSWLIVELKSKHI
jgi:hypothetical protein